jgi:DNA-binding GntR family transcriptional regulator
MPLRPDDDRSALPPGERSSAGGLLARRASVGDDVYDVLLTRLIALKIPPGARINVDTLVRELGVSQTPIRAALIRLETEGLVEKTHLVGYSAVPLPSRQRLEQIYELRLLLEPLAAERAARHLRPQTRDELKGLARAMEQSAPDLRLGHGKFAKCDARFHSLIASEGGGPVIAEALARLHSHMHIFRIQLHSRVTEAAIGEHAELLNALVAGNAKGARDAMKQHIARSLKRVAPILDQLDDDPATGKLRRPRRSGR